MSIIKQGEFIMAKVVTMGEIMLRLSTPRNEKFFRRDFKRTF